MLSRRQILASIGISPIAGLLTHDVKAAESEEENPKHLHVMEFNEDGEIIWGNESEYAMWTRSVLDQLSDGNKLAAVLDQGYETIRPVWVPKEHAVFGFDDWGAYYGEMYLVEKIVKETENHEDYIMLKLLPHEQSKKIPLCFENLITGYVAKKIDNPNNLPVMEFDEDGQMASPEKFKFYTKEDVLNGTEDEEIISFLAHNKVDKAVKVWVPKSCPVILDGCHLSQYGEMILIGWDHTSVGRGIFFTLCLAKSTITLKNKVFSRSKHVEAF